MNPNQLLLIDHGAAVMYRGSGTALDEVVQAPNLEPSDQADIPLENLWEQVDILQDFIENPGDVDEPVVNEQPPLHVVDNVPRKSISERPVAADHSHHRGPRPSTNCKRYTCEPCPFSSNIKRDYHRHLKTPKHRRNTENDGHHSASGSAVPNLTTFRCPVPECKFNASGKTFSRDDHLWRHIRKVPDIKKET